MFQTLSNINLKRLFLLCFFFCLLITFESQAQIKPEYLSSETLVRMEKVPEFKFIQKEARKLGVEVYLFGGTASAFAHYVRWDLEREAGDDKYQKERFDYDFTNIYRGNQDLDIVVDGTAEQAAQLQQILKEKFPHFVGDREAWEVRLLQASLGDKQPLLGDADFKNQHTDTNSTGMISLNPKPNGIVFRDLLDWENPKSQFLEDITNARIKYLFNEKHSSTKRYLEGKNPPVLSAIRYLAKLTQYEVKGTPEDLELVTRIIAEQDFTQLDWYGKKKAEEFGLKALLNTPDVEFAYKLLRKTGLIEKLIQMDDQSIEDVESLSWWANKEPLKSFEVGLGSGTTASTIFNVSGVSELIVSHETQSFAAYENITRSTKGRANVFISRQEVDGEAAAFGNGFYTAIGQEGAVGSGLTIRFKLDPNAREGTDFIYANDYIVVLNKNALTLIQENINLSLYGFLKLITSGDIKDTDLGLLEKFKRKLQRSNNSDIEDFKKARDLLKVELKNLISNEQVEILNIIIEYILSQESWSGNPEIIETLLKSEIVDQTIVDHILTKDYWGIRVDWLKLLVKNGNVDQYEMFLQISSQKEWGNSPEFVEEFLKNTESVSTLGDILEFILSKETWSQHPYLIEMLIKRGDLNEDIAEYILSKDYWGQYSHLVEMLLKKGDADYSIILYVLTKEYSSAHPEWLISLIKKGKYKGILTKYVLNKPHWKTHPKVESYLKGMDVSVELPEVSTDVDGGVDLNHLYKIFEMFSLDQNQAVNLDGNYAQKTWTKSHKSEDEVKLSREVKDQIKDWTKENGISKEALIFRGIWPIQNSNGNRMGMSIHAYVFEHDDGISKPRLFTFSQKYYWESGSDSTTEYSSIVSISDEDYKKLMPGKSLVPREPLLKVEEISEIGGEIGEIDHDLVPSHLNVEIEGKVNIDYLYQIFEVFSEDQNQAVGLDGQYMQKVWVESNNSEERDKINREAKNKVKEWSKANGIPKEALIFRGVWPIQRYTGGGMGMSIAAYVFEYDDGVSEPKLFTFSQTYTWGGSFWNNHGV